MSILTGSIQLGYKDATWFTSNPTLVLLSGQIVYRQSDGKYKIGDGTTQLQNLTFYGGTVAWGSIIGTLSDQTDLQSALDAKLSIVSAASTYVPLTRTLTINGTAYDLSANRSWSVGDVFTSGSYSNPSWITALAWSKIISTPTTLAGYGIADGQPLDGDLTAIAALSGSNGFLKKLGPDTWAIDTNTYLTTALAASTYVPLTRTITINGTAYDLSADRSWSVGDVLTSGSYANPSWITSLSWSKITSTPTTISGYGITDTTAQLLTGLSISGSTISSSDSILQAFGKLQSQINGVLGGAIYQSTWNASTNSPSLSSGVGTKGYYYVVSVAGSTNLDGTTDWKVGDWAIFNGTIWQKVDNTDAVSSVNGQIGAVSLVTTDIPEGTNLYYTNARGIGSVLTGYTSGAGTISATDTILQAIQKLNGNITGLTTANIAAAANNRIVITSGGTLALNPAQTTGQISYYDANGLPTGSTGLTYVSGLLTITGTSQQFKLAYDSSYYHNVTVNNTGTATYDLIAAAGTPVFQFNRRVHFGNGGTYYGFISGAVNLLTISAVSGLSIGANSIELIRMNTTGQIGFGVSSGMKSTFEFYGSIGNRLTTVTSGTSANINVSDRVLCCEITNTNAFTYTLPAASDVYNSSSIGIEYVVVDTGQNAGVNNITINTTGGDTFTNGDSSTSVVINTNGGILRIQCISSTKWSITND